MKGVAAALAAVVVAGSAGSAAGRVTALTRISTDPFGAEVQGSHATEVEPSAAAAGRRIVAVFQVGRRFPGGAAAIGFAASSDGGETWQHSLLPGLTAAGPGSGPAAWASDPVVAYDAAHARWLAATLSPVGVGVSASGDGTTWGAPVWTHAVGFLDKEWLACDNWPGSPFRGRCYIALAVFSGGDASNPRVAVQTSTDGGATWSRQVEAPVDQGTEFDAVLSPEPVVRPNGELVILFQERAGMRVIRSTDGGVSFRREAVSGNPRRPYSYSGDHLRATNAPSVAADANGKVYAAWYDCRFRPGCTGDDIVITRSTAPGSWTEPVRVPLGQQDETSYLFPSLGVDGPRVALAYYTLSSHDCTGAGCTLQAGLATSVDGGATWTTEPIGQPMDLTWLAPTSLGRMVGDYFAAVLVPGKAVGVFSLAGPPSGGGFDEAIHAATVPLTVKLDGLRFTARPSAPAAGRSFALRGISVKLEGGGWARPSTVRCHAALGRKTLRASGPCRWRLPAKAAGRRLTVTVRAGYAGTTISVARRYAVR